MPKVIRSALHPRKTPVQSRSTTTVEAILEATIQVLIAQGKEKLTTTLVAQRAGVSVGTLYQYFPNKISLLQACLKRHMSVIGSAMIDCAQGLHGKPILEMSAALIEAYLRTKMKNPQESAALYAVSSDIDGAMISKSMSVEVHRHVTGLFRTAQEKLTKEPELMASVVLSAMNGISRRILEAKSPAREYATLRGELIVLVESYLKTCLAV